MNANRAGRPSATVVALARLGRAGAVALLLGLSSTVPAVAQFKCFPSCADDDGRLLAIAGTGLGTLSDTVLEIQLSVPAGTTSFEIGIFDGDGAVKVGPQNRWDTGDEAAYEFTLFADPLGNSQGATVVPLTAGFPTVTGSQMVNSEWCCSAIAAAATPGTPGNFLITTGPEAQAPSGNFFYRLRIEGLALPPNHLNGFKVRTSGIVTIEASQQPFSYVANFGGGAAPPDDVVLLFPDLAVDLSNINDPAVRATSTYDGSFDFFFEVDTIGTELTVWDGDFDFGAFGGDRECAPQPACLIAGEQDSDDLDTPNVVPDFALGAQAVPEGVAVGTTTSGVTTTGAPEDDLNPSIFLFNLKVRQPSVRWDLFTPDGQVFGNDNPSGNLEWERFTLSTAPFDDTLMDVSVPSIELGTYRMRIEGVDMQNLNAILLPLRVLCVDVFGAACEPLKPYLVGDTVFLDSDGDGLQEVGEPGIGGVIVNLLDANGNLADSTTTDGAGNYSFEVEDAGTSEIGDPIPAVFSVEVAPENFTGPAPTGGAVGDRVWIDADQDGFQGDPALEPGIANVVVRLFEAGIDQVPGGGDDSFVAATVTDADGLYRFDSGLPAGTYFVVVDDATVPAGLSLTSGTDPSAPTGAVPPASLSHDFGYDNTSATTANVGDRVWSDADGDGLQDAGESGIGGVTLDLVDGASMVVATTTTDGAGYYLFTGVPAAVGGTAHSVVVTDTGGVLAAYGQTGDPDEAGVCVVCDGGGSVILSPGDHISTLDFGYRNGALSSITDRAWLDADHDGSQDVGELGIDGVTVSLSGFGGQVIATTVTAGGGDFSFDGLPDGEYTILITDLAGALDSFLPTTPPAVAGSHGVEIDGADVSALSFGYNTAGALDGLVGTTDADAKPPGNNATVITTELQSGPVPIEDGADGSTNNLDFDFGYRAPTPAECLLDIDFETDAAGADLHTGQVIDDEWAALGITVTTHDPVFRPAMVFDSAAPTGGDLDLGTPHQDFGGPGIGSGGGAGTPGENALSRGKVLIISEDGDSTDPDDSAAGGTIIFTFATAVRIDRVGILDIDEGMAGTITAYDAETGGGVIRAVGMVDALGDNSFQTVIVAASGVRRLEVRFPSSGAITDIVFCAEQEACAPRRVRDNFSVVSFANNDGPESWSGDWIEVDPQSGGAGPTAGQVQVHGGVLTLDDYPPTGGEPSAAREVDLSGADSATLRFSFLTSAGVDPDDAVTVEVSNDGGATWSTLEVFDGIRGAVQRSRSYDITAFASARTQVRFRVSRRYGGVDEVFCVRFVEIESTCGTCRAISVRDDLRSRSFANNDGPDDWSGPWIERDPEAGGAGPWAGQVQVRNGFMWLDDHPPTGSDPSAARQVDLSGAAAATLSYAFRTSHAVDATDEATVEVSSNGGASWATLEVITGIVGSSSGTRSFDITAWAAVETQVRFRISRRYGLRDEFFKVNWVQIESTCGDSP